ncbi:hypothetical protein BOTBODRAFT_100756 [Botryobasidium botryosum FD-172 SS1]|uniref:Poly A polymerase head domain-containing protein n=1 Tax=Botryobasidium botryosum (strain FD-172 SS1) TaxID=930990 RepID=A0A067MXY5_BOTB1|nr:hypothetical protein BOTBODRAFT_100756 [Botryobasidium botryosum FD-172 SS1]
MASNSSLRHLQFRAAVDRPVELKIQLTPKEEEICTLLDDCCKNLLATRPDIKPVECRIAGGWVRDKLLGLGSNDIDIGLSSIMGVDFAELLVAFLSSKDGNTVDATIAKIARNPDQSKHLETAKVKLLDTEIDLVNLRSEVYTQDSRIPSEIAFGTPLEDALRRDITINALFYNVHTRSVEDLTEKGLDDLRAGAIRTPLPPLETFADDPLRVLRCVRFASRFGFKLEEEVKEAIKDPVIQEALKIKISRERVGDEIDKMMKGRDPLLALWLIDTLALHDSIFYIPLPLSSTLSGSPGPRSTSLAAASILQTLTSPSEGISFRIHPALAALANDPSVMRRLFLASALTPFKGISYKEKKREPLAAEAVIREGLKIGNQNHYLDAIPALFQSTSMISSAVLSELLSISPGDPRNPRAAIGLFLREKSIHYPLSGTHWTSSLLFALVQELVASWDAENQTLNAATGIIGIYNEFVQRVIDLDLTTAVDEKPRLDGRQVCALLSIKPSPTTGLILSRVIEWQLENPQGSEEECQQWLKAEFEAGRLPSAPIGSDITKRPGGEGKEKAKKMKVEPK